MSRFRFWALFAALPLVFMACGGGSTDDTVAAERERGDGAEASQEAGEHSGHDESSTHEEHEESDHHEQAEASAGAEDAALTIDVEMTEFAYEPDEFEVPAGEPITFVFHNSGEIEHEAMVGDAHMQEEFAESGDHGGAGHHGDVDAVTVAPGETRKLTVQFDEPGETMLGCHLPGHWAAGMAATVTVVPA